MSDYAKLKNVELENMLKERGLPHSGKKADMVTRLQEDDKKKGTTGAVPPAQTTTNDAEDEIDWGDDAEETSKPADDKTADVLKDAAEATTEADSAAIAAGGIGRVDNPRAVPNQKHDEEDPATTHDLTVKNAAPVEGSTGQPATIGDASATEAETPKPAVDFTSGLANATWEEELEKRRKRAAKFGTEFDEEKEKEQLKLLARAEKFGGDAAGPQGLNEALDDSKGRKRGRDRNDEGRNEDNKRRGGQGGRGGRRDDRRRDDRRGGQGRRDERRDGGRRNDGGRRDGGRGRDRRGTPRRGTPQRDAPRRDENKANGQGNGKWMNDKDREAAERRKERFASKPEPAKPEASQPAAAKAE